MKKLTLCILLLSALLLMSSAAFAQRITITNGNLPRFTKTWMTAAWTGDSAPYIKIEKDLDAEVARGQSFKDIIANARAKAQKNRLDPHALFAYGYAAQQAYQSHDTQYLIGDVYEWLSETKTENIYEYARLRFLLAQECYPNGDNYYLKSLGERLLKRDPNDEQVRKALIYALCTDKKGIQEALRIANKAVLDHPTDPTTHAVMASVYRDMWFGNESDSAFAKKAIAEFQQYLKLAPANDWFRKDAIMQVKALEHGVSRKPSAK